MRTFTLMTFIVIVLGLASATSADTSSPRVVARSTTYGHILFDGRGFVLYAFTHDRHGRSTCSGACAKAWPPYLVRQKPSIGSGAKTSLVGVVRRSNGRLQATYAGHPLYYYVGDRKPGQILCQNVVEFGGRWLVVGRRGSLIR